MALTRHGAGGFLSSAAGKGYGVISACLSVVVISAAVLWLTGIYASGLRDPRYFDGWILAGGMIFQVLFHIGLKAQRLSPASLIRWRRFHIFTGYALIAIFISHTGYTLPDTLLEWALLIGFALITFSGLVGTYLSWSRKSRPGLESVSSIELLAQRQTELQRAAENVVVRVEPAAQALPLPAQPHQSWVLDLYAHHLRPFLTANAGLAARLPGSESQLQKILEEIDALAPYVDASNQKRLEALKDLAREKDNLDRAAAHSLVAKGWLWVHVPVTYALALLTVVHVVVAYAYSSGAW